MHWLYVQFVLMPPGTFLVQVPVRFVNACNTYVLTVLQTTKQTVRKTIITLLFQHSVMSAGFPQIKKPHSCHLSTTQPLKFVIKLSNGNHAHKVGITLVITIASYAKPTVLYVMIILAPVLYVPMEIWICSPITLVAAISERLLMFLSQLLKLAHFQALSKINQPYGLVVANQMEPQAAVFNAQQTALAAQTTLVFVLHASLDTQFREIQLLNKFHASVNRLMLTCLLKTSFMAEPDSKVLESV